jgi:hypothetical protein
MCQRILIVSHSKHIFITWMFQRSFSCLITTTRSGKQHCKFPVWWDFTCHEPLDWLAEKTTDDGAKATARRGNAIKLALPRRSLRISIDRIPLYAVSVLQTHFWGIFVCPSDGSVKINWVWVWVWVWGYLYVCMYKVSIFGVFEYFYRCITLLVFSCLFCFCFLVKFLFYAYNAFGFLFQESVIAEGMLWVRHAFQV